METRYQDTGDREMLFVISDILLSGVNKQYKTKQIHSFGLEKIVCCVRSLYIEYPLYMLIDKQWAGRIGKWGGGGGGF